MGPYKKTALLLGIGYCALSLLSVSIVAHPQCLDSLPPFEREKSWCKEYPTDMCCTGRDEVTMIFDEVIPTIRKALTTDRNRFNSSCLNDILKVACTRCSPWAQHVYEGVVSEGRPFPSLCKPFCKYFYTTCYSLLFDYFKLNATKYPRGDPGAESFCKDHEANVPYYCYPDIVSGPKFSTSESVDNTDDKDCLCGVTVASGLRNPIAAIPPGDGSGRLFIPEQKGKIRVLTKENVLLNEPFLDIASEVLVTARRGDERGLLGMAFHPNYVQNGRFYVYYSSSTNRRHISKVSEFKVSSTSPNVANPNSECVIFTINQPEGNHNGGQVFFKEGYLYIVLGDGGGAYDRHGRIGHGLDTSTLLGSILRVDVSNPNVTYTIPPDNPFADGVGGRPEIFAYGLRNPWRCSVDRGDADGRGKGRIFCGDVGQNRFEEIDIIEKGGNYGWRAYEGFHCSDARLCEDSLSESLHSLPLRWHNDEFVHNIYSHISLTVLS